MKTSSELTKRIDAEFSAAEQRLAQFRSQHVQEYHDRRQRLERFERAMDQLRNVWEPRLDALAGKFGDRVDVHPTSEPGRRSATFEFKSSLASVTLRLTASPDAHVQKIIFMCDVEILPILMEFDSHSELEQPLGEANSVTLAEWLDDRIVSFVQTYLALHENQYYVKDQMVEDPIANVQFPRFAAAATLEHDGKPMYFIDESTLREFQQRTLDVQT